MKVSRSIDVEAPPSVIWEVMADVTSWPEWSESFRSVEWVEGSSLEVGAVARIRQPAIPPAKWTVTQVEPGRSFAWRTRNMGINFDADHVIEEIPTGARVTQVLEMTGIGAVLLRPIIGRATGKALDKESRGLKARAEERARATP